MAEKEFDFVVIGGGPGGYVAAIRASQLGYKTALVEGQHLGGICLNWGCIPTKALLRTSEIAHTLNRIEEFGFELKNGYTFDTKKVVKRSRDVAAQLSKGVQHLLKKNKVTVFDGWGKLKGKGEVTVEKDGKEIENLKGRHIILATGARARELPGLEPDGKLVWTYKEAMVPEEMPKKLLVVGSGAIGIEFASFYHNMGVDVTVMEVMDRILPAEDEEISAFAKKTFDKQGLKIKTGVKVNEINKKDNSVDVKYEVSGKVETEEFDRVVMAVGVVGNVENIGLENTKVKTDRNQIQVNEWLETDEPGIYAIGDVVSAPWLAHKASHEGVICVEKIADIDGVHPMKKENIPACTYCHPQVASIGLSETKAKEQGYDVRVGRFPFQGNGKAIALGEAEGLVKTIFDKKSGELLGAHMIGAEVTELIQGFSIGKTLETTEEELMQTIFPHPTLSEMMHESVLDAYDKVIHF